MSDILYSSNKLQRTNEPPSPIGELHDDLLINIFCRVTCESVYACKFVSKNWCSLISNPKFAIYFLDHKRSNDAVAIPGSITLVLRNNRLADDSSFITLSDDGKLLVPNFTLKFLPCRVKIAATFKDLVLCYNYSTTSRTREYYICNPFTMQWLTLPPSPPLSHDEDKYWITLVVEDNYKFRVVMMVRNPFKYYCGRLAYDPLQSVELIIYCSESRQWKKDVLQVPTSHTCRLHSYNSGFRDGVICNKMIYFMYSALVWEFDPFSFKSRTFPLPDNDGGRVWKVMESQGRVLLIKKSVTSFIKMRELVLDKSSNTPWHPTANTRLNKFGIHDDFQVLGVHPSNKKLLYLRIENQGLFSCNLWPWDKKPLCLQFPSCSLFVGTRLEIPSSPTPLPVMHSLV